MPVKIIISIWPLFAGLSLIGLAVGVQGSLLGVRAELEGFDDYLIGLLMSCYFAGFLAGSLLYRRHLIQPGGPYPYFCRACAAVATMCAILFHSYLWSVALGLGANATVNWVRFFDYLCGLRKLVKSIIEQR